MFRTICFFPFAKYMFQSDACVPINVKLNFLLFANCRGNTYLHYVPLAVSWQFLEIILVIIDEGKHTFPSRTRSLSPQSLMVVQPRCCVRVSCCQSCDPRLLNRGRGSFYFYFSNSNLQYLHLMGNLKKKRRLKMNKHKRRKRTRANRHKKRDW